MGTLISNAPKFFRTNPKKGRPISQAGMAEALQKMAHALETLSVHGGRVEWANGEPKIIFDDK